MLVDSGSTDPFTTKYLNLLENGKFDPRIQVYYLGQAAFGIPSIGRNFAMTKVKGSLIAWLDDDDYWYHDKLAKFVFYMETNPEVDVLFS